MTVTSDIARSLRRALIEQGWVFGDVGHRVGHPFVHANGNDVLRPNGTTEGSGLFEALAVIRNLSAVRENYETPAEIRSPDFDKARTLLARTFSDSIDHFAPFPTVRDSLAPYLDGFARAYGEDYSAIRKMCPDLPQRPVHLDLGAGVGSHAAYSLPLFDSRFIAVEACPWSYAAQRAFFRYLCTAPGEYMDPIVAEGLGVPRSEIAAAIADGEAHRIRHVPSWYFQDVPDASVDLVSATWILNEVTPSTIAWLLCHATRTLREGGYFYIRDSNRMKPEHHPVDYDKALLDLGFAPSGRLDVHNRLDVFGLPRAYRKERRVETSFLALVDRYFPRTAVVCHGGAYMQNVEAP